MRPILLISLRLSLGQVWVGLLAWIQLDLEPVVAAQLLKEKIYAPKCFRYDMRLEFSEAIFGTEKEFELSHLETCEACNGTGAKMGSKMRICSTCGGRGQVMRTEQTPFGLFSQVSVCPNCGGDGEMISEYCRKCAGEGRLRVKKDIKVKIPPGVGKGSILRVAGEGDAGQRVGLLEIFMYTLK
ncbi:hypothetical protein Sjap_019298 [Stephania japonica]|uniref:CR-type domain-containing protein n=1 Tax=Stephania japonica TaxID=461633 RepID=A0AAP0HZL2_9MAGN